MKIKIIVGFFFMGSENVSLKKGSMHHNLNIMVHQTMNKGTGTGDDFGISI